jgi:hypothetical protein
MKAYYLTIKQFNFIYNYINKTDQIISAEHFDDANGVGDLINIDNLDKKLLYSGLLCVDTLLNTNVYTFTHFKAKEPQIKILESISPRSKLNSKPKIKSLVKLIKYLTNSFPSYSTEFFMYHLYSKSGVSKALTAQDLVVVKSQLSKKVGALGKTGIKSIEIHSIQQNSNITIKNINVNSNSCRHYKTTSNTRDSSDFNKILPQTKLNSGNVSGGSSIKSQTKANKLIPNKLNFGGANNLNNVYVVARDNQIRYKTELDDSEDSISIAKHHRANVTHVDYNTPTKKKVVRYYS